MIVLLDIESINSSYGVNNCDFSTMNQTEELVWDGSKEDLYASAMEGTAGSPKLLTVEEKWQIIFNEKTRAPIYGVTHYIQYLTQFINGEITKPRGSNDVIKKDGINPVSYLLRKLKLDLKMSYESFLDDFLQEGNDGMNLLVKLLKSIQTIGSQQSGSAKLSQLKNYKRTLTDEHDCLLCIKYSMRSRTALPLLLDITYGLETVSMGLMSTFTKSRGTAIEILTVALSSTEGFSRVLDCFTHIRLKIGEPVRFKSLMNMMNLQSHQNVLFKVSSMKFLNSLLNTSPNLNTRVYLQHELETAGLDVNLMEERARGTGLEFDDLRFEILEWRRKYIDVETLLNLQNATARPVDPDPQLLQKMEDLQKEIQMLKSEKSTLERKMEATSSELRLWYEEQKRRSHTRTVAIQVGNQPTNTDDFGCQCNIMKAVDPYGNPLKTAADYFGWQDSGEHHAVYYSEHKDKVKPHPKDPDNSDEGVEKVNHWLRAYYDSSESDLDMLPMCFRDDAFTRRRKGQGYHRPHKKNVNLYYQHPRAGEIPVNWSFAPKFSGKFPSRLEECQGHAANCDRCLIANARMRNNRDISEQPIKHHNAHSGPTPVGVGHTRPDSKSLSSDSALGGSGERLWSAKDGRIPLLPAEEAEILQDLIQPDDSASGIPPGEPCPDYSTLTTDDQRTDESYNHELSNILKDFEGQLNAYDPDTTQRSGSYRKYITVGDF